MGSQYGSQCRGSVCRKTSVNNPAAAKVVAAIASSIGQARNNKALAFGPTANCQTFVISDGMITSAAALAGAMNRPRKPIATVGSPMPATPWTRPARTNVSVNSMITRDRR